MSSRYIQGRCQPDKAIDLVDEAASRLRVQRSVMPDNVRQLRAEVAAAQREKDYAIASYGFPQAAQSLFRERQKRLALMRAEDDWHCSNQQQERPVLYEQDIAKVVAVWTGIPVVHIAEKEGQRLLNLEYELHRRVVGQHEAVQAVARAVRRSRANVGDSRRPIGSFVFAGPTGVGKTELARALAAALFGDEAAMLKLDMSEFMESHHISRLIGAPPGYIGYEEAGQLTEAVRRRPYSLVLFDEIEKAHPKIFDILLQILEDGCLTDARGQIVDFKHTLIIITSNVGTEQLGRGVMAFTTKGQSSQKSSVDAHERIRKLILPALKNMFRPELFNRVDEVIVFHRLELEHLREIVDLMVAQVQQRLAEQSIDCRVTSAARLMLAELGYHPEHGARHLRRTVQRLLEDMLAEAILQGTIAPGDSALVDVNDGALFVSVPTLVRAADSLTKGDEDQIAA
ncbi:MAG: AAA family ATPase, partial [Chloroflexi bacterium]|nr:AAA family ATPase [Chloroflexota bacterium]